MAKKAKQKEFKNVDEAFSALVRKDFQKKLRSQAQKKFDRLKFESRLQKAPIRTSLQIQQQQSIEAQKRRRVIGTLGSKAEELEIEVTSYNEVPTLKAIERQQMRATSPPNKTIQRIEKEVTDSFPD